MTYAIQMHTLKIDLTFWASLFNFARSLKPDEIKHRNIEIKINDQQCTIPINYSIFRYKVPRDPFEYADKERDGLIGIVGKQNLTPENCKKGLAINASVSGVDEAVDSRAIYELHPVLMDGDIALLVKGEPGGENTVEEYDKAIHDSISRDRDDEGEDTQEGRLRKALGFSRSWGQVQKMEADLYRCGYVKILDSDGGFLGDMDVLTNPYNMGEDNLELGSLRSPFCNIVYGTDVGKEQMLHEEFDSLTATFESHRRIMFEALKQLGIQGIS